jgi:broad specificity phosphatase PhoE
MGLDEVLRLRPHIWDDRSADYWGWSPPGGETFHQVLERTTAGLDEIRASHPDGTVALVAHMGTVRMLLCHLAGISLEGTYDLEFPSTCVSVFRLVGDRVEVETLNDASHVA